MRGLAKKTLEQIEACHKILKVEQPTTVRAVAYRLFTRGLIPNMSKNSTNKVSRWLTIGRENGTIPWSWIVDETRAAERANLWDKPDQIIQSAVNGYRKDYWNEQPKRVEVWSEKGTVRGILQEVLNQYGVTFRVMHGFASATVMNDIAEQSWLSEKPLIVFYVGDYDPSGMYMSDVDLPGRLERYNGKANIKRVALTHEDILDPMLPGFNTDTKKTDTRHKWYVDQYGKKAWELDAMRSDLLRERVEQSIKSMIDMDAWNHAIDIEKEEVQSMQKFHKQWKESAA